MVRVALDAMGGDHAPTETVAGAALAALRGHEVVLVGDTDVLEPLCDRQSFACTIVHADQVVEMADNPAAAIREKPKSSIIVATELVKVGEADAVVSAGSTGAALTAAVVILGRVPGVRRPAIAAVLPTEPRTILIDGGANPEVGPEHLYQFAVMGSLLAEHEFEMVRPTVGLLSIGHEEGKGRALERDAARLLQQSDLAFVGNVEGHDVMRGHVNVVVTDGFTGNAILKTMEGAVAWLAKLGVSAGTPLAPQILSKLDPEGTGGAHLVGLNGVVVIAHGSSSRVAIANAVEVAAAEAGAQYPEALQRRLA